MVSFIRSKLAFCAIAVALQCACPRNETPDADSCDQTAAFDFRVIWTHPSEVSFETDPPTEVAISASSGAWTVTTVADGAEAARIEFVGAMFDRLGAPPETGTTLQGYEDPEELGTGWIRVNDAGGNLVLHGGDSRTGYVGVRLGIGGAGDELIEGQRPNDREIDCQVGSEIREKVVLTTEIAPGNPLASGESIEGFYGGYRYVAGNVSSYVYYDGESCSFPCNDANMDTFFSRSFVARLDDR